MSKRVRIEDEMASIDPYISVEDVISICNRVLDMQKSNDWVDVYTNPTGNEDGGIVFVGKRWETDKEFNNRLKWEARSKKEAEEAKLSNAERERKEYERLKKKFEGK